ncbi:nSTAND1 domain-containing NTPase [Sorangium sp. So ce145]|uniref:nSTAND1 domain-containing NTPase n=1 Tax=Sorangium sp. So ce145 TaxID=3133285 RepID=UPI003F5E910A
MKPSEAGRHEAEEPARGEGILDALATTRGALPLLQFTAAKLRERRDRRRMLFRRASYEVLGGVAGALAGQPRRRRLVVSEPSRRCCPWSLSQRGRGSRS